MAAYQAVSLRLLSEVMTSLKLWAKEEDKSFNKLMTEIIEAALRQRAKALYMQTLIPEINDVLDQRFNAFTNRTAHLMVRSFLEIATTRRLLLETAFHHLSDEELAQLNNEAWSSSVKSLKTTTEELQTLQRNLREGLL